MKREGWTSNIREICPEKTLFGTLWGESKSVLIASTALRIRSLGSVQPVSRQPSIGRLKRMRISRKRRHAGSICRVVSHGTTICECEVIIRSTCGGLNFYGRLLMPTSRRAQGWHGRKCFIIHQRCTWVALDVPTPIRLFGGTEKLLLTSVH